MTGQDKTAPVGVALLSLRKGAPPLQFSLGRLGEKVRATFPLFKRGIDAPQHPGREAGWRLLVILFRAPHARGDIRYHFLRQAVHFSDITY